MKRDSTFSLIAEWTPKWSFGQGFFGGLVYQGRRQGQTNIFVGIGTPGLPKTTWPTNHFGIPLTYRFIGLGAMAVTQQSLGPPGVSREPTHNMPDQSFFSSLLILKSTFISWILGVPAAPVGQIDLPAGGGDAPHRPEG